jgi:hypothetical protein
VSWCEFDILESWCEFDILESWCVFEECELTNLVSGREKVKVFLMSLLPVSFFYFLEQD